MKEQVVSVSPTRENWQAFCSEPELTPEERELWHKIKSLTRTNSEFLEFCLANVEPEKQVTFYTPDWSDMVGWADEDRKWKRRHFSVYERWEAEHG